MSEMNCIREMQDIIDYKSKQIADLLGRLSRLEQFVLRISNACFDYIKDPDSEFKNIYDKIGKHIKVNKAFNMNPKQQFKEIEK